MTDAADKVVADEERAMAVFQARRPRFEASPEAFARHTRINCVDCGDVIPEARLRAMPRTVRCTSCATDVERPWRG